MRSRLRGDGGTHRARRPIALEGDGVTDDDIPVRLALARARRRRCTLDFTGSAPQVRGNVNCPAAVTRAAALFALRTLLDDDVPTNDGIARAITLVLPRSQRRERRVAGGRGRGQRGDVAAHRRHHPRRPRRRRRGGAAQGQGTMNNVTFGGAGWTFYETLGGGQGASAARRRARRRCTSA